MYISNLKEQLENFLKEKILPYFDILTLTENNNNQNSDLIKEVLLSLVVDDYYKDTLQDTTELSFYSEDIITDELIQKIRPALINRLTSYGLPKNILEQFSTNELLLMYYNYYILDKHKASVKQIIEIFKLFNLNIISVAELYINYDYQTDTPYFIPQWIYNPLNLKINKLDYDTIYNNTPGFLIDKQTIINNKDNIVFPVKTNILYITSSQNRDLSTLSYLKAVYTAYILKDQYISIELPISTGSYETVNINDIPIITYYMSLLYYDTEYIDSSDNIYNDMIFYVPLLLEIISYDENNFIQKIEEYSSFENNTDSNNLYKHRAEFREFISTLTQNTYLDNTQNILSRTYLETYIKETYPKLYNDIRYIFDVLKTTDIDSYKNKLTLLLTNILGALIIKFSQIINSTGKNINIDYFISYIDFFFQYGSSLINVISLITKKYLLLIKYNLPAFIHITDNYDYTQYIIKSLDNSVYLYSYTTIKYTKTDISFVLYREQYNLNMYHNENIRFNIFDINDAQIKIDHEIQYTVNNEYYNSIYTNNFSREKYNSRHEQLNTITINDRYLIIDQINVTVSS